MQHRVFKVFRWAASENKAMTVGVYKQLHQKKVTLWNFKNYVFGFFNLTSEAEHVLDISLFFWQIEPLCSYKVCS